MAEMVLLIRHGQSTFNAHYEATGEDPQLIDAPLSSLGEEQVAKAAQTLANTTVDLVVTSPFTRAIQTSLGLFGDRDIPIVVSDLHREQCFASCDIGRDPAILGQAFPRLDFSHLSHPWWYTGEASAEPDAVVQERITRFIDWLRSRPEAAIAAVGHGGFYYQLTGQTFANCDIHSLQL